MFEILHEVAQFTAWTGLSLGMLVGLAALFYFIPGLRLPAVIGAGVVVIGYGCLVYGNHAGRTNVKAEWDAANVKAAQEAQARDDAVAKSEEAKYAPIIAAREKQIEELKKQIQSPPQPQAPQHAKPHYLRPLNILPSGVR